MINEINYFYKLYPEEISKIDNGYSFYIGDIKYYLLFYTKSIREFEMVLTIYNGFKNRNILIDEIILNVFGSYFSMIDGNNYFLLKVNESSNEKSLKEINVFDNVLKTNKKDELGYVNWNDLWGKKVDYYESRIIDLRDIEYVKMSFDYYVGLSENAISYVRETIEGIKNDDLVIGHKRLSKKFNNVYNPFNLVVDYESRDIAEYIKSKFFYDIFSFSELEELVESKVFSEFSLRMLFGRLLYPSYYFDVIDKLFRKENALEELKCIIDKINLYEEFLIEVFDYLSSFYPLPKIDWLYRNR